MTSIKNEILSNISSIDEVTLESDLNVMSELIEFYDKAYLCLEYFSGTDVQDSNIHIFQESVFLEDAESSDNKGNFLQKIGAMIANFFSMIQSAIEKIIKKIKGEKTKESSNEEKELKAETASMISIASRANGNKEQIKQELSKKSNHALAAIATLLGITAVGGAAVYNATKKKKNAQSSSEENTDTTTNTTEQKPEDVSDNETSKDTTEQKPEDVSDNETSKDTTDETGSENQLPFNYADRENNIFITGIKYDIKDTITNVEIPSEIDGKPVTIICNNAFEQCHNLKSVTIPDSVKSIGDKAFCNCTKLTSITIPDNVERIRDFAFLNCKSLTSITIPESVYHIGEGAFAFCESLTSITIPASANVNKFAFVGCTNLKNIEASDEVKRQIWKVIKTKEEDTTEQKPEDVSDNETLNDTTAPVSEPDNSDSYNKDETEKLYDKYIGAENDPYKRTVIDELSAKYLPSDNKLLFKTSTFHLDDESNNDPFIRITGCNDKDVESIEIPSEIDGKPVTTIDEGAFEKCHNLKSVTIPDSVKSIGEHAFANCTSLTSVTIPDSVTDIYDRAFAYCSSLKSIKIPSNIVRIWEGTFLECSNLESVILPDGLKYIQQFAFCNCRSLTNITIPESIIFIDKGAFENCPDSIKSSIPSKFKKRHTQEFIEMIFNGGNIHDNSIHEKSFSEMYVQEQNISEKPQSKNMPTMPSIEEELSKPDIKEELINRIVEEMERRKSRIDGINAELQKNVENIAKYVNSNVSGNTINKIKFDMPDTGEPELTIYGINEDSCVSYFEASSNIIEMFKNVNVNSNELDKLQNDLVATGVSLETTTKNFRDTFIQDNVNGKADLINNLIKSLSMFKIDDSYKTSVKNITENVDKITQNDPSKKNTIDKYMKKILDNMGILANVTAGFSRIISIHDKVINVLRIQPDVQ